MLHLGLCAKSSFAYILYIAQTICMRSQELWEMFQATGDVELYAMYRTLKEEEQEGNTKDDE